MITASSASKQDGKAIFRFLWCEAGAAAANEAVRLYLRASNYRENQSETESFVSAMYPRPNDADSKAAEKEGGV